MQELRNNVCAIQKTTAKSEEASDYADLVRFLRHIRTHEFTKELHEKYSRTTINTYVGRRALWGVIFEEESLACVLNMAHRRDHHLILEWDGLKRQLLESLSDWIVESVTNLEHCFMKKLNEAHDDMVLAFVALLNNIAQKRVLQLLRQLVRDGRNVTDRVVYLESMEISKDTQRNLIFGAENNSQMELLVEIACWILLEIHGTMSSINHDMLMIPKNIYLVENTFEMRLQRTHYY